MGLDKVKEDILNRAEERADEIVEEAKAEREQMIQDAQEQADEIIADAETDAEDKAEQKRRKELAAARMEARRKELAAQQDVLDDAFTAFREQVADLEEDEETDLVESILDRLQDDVEIGSIRTPEHNADLAEDYGTVETDDSIRGVIVETADGSRRFNFTFEEVADKVITNAKKDVSQVLFG